MNVNEITAAMLPAIEENQYRFPRAIFVPCDCRPRPQRPHLPHEALPMRVPVATSASIVLGGVVVR